MLAEEFFVFDNNNYFLFSVDLHCDKVTNVNKFRRERNTFKIY